jgi:diacylglycerol kinase (ATP)
MPMQARLIFNPASGNPAESAAQLLELLRQLQTQQIQAEVLVVQPEHHLDAIARIAARSGAKMVIVSGGDGTIEHVALGLVGSQTTLGIIPTGTRNNLARSLGIPTDAGTLADAVALLRDGRQLEVDVGKVRRGEASRGFLEAGVIGLASSLYPSADDIQHGDLGKIAEFISTLVSAEPSEIRLRVDHNRREFVTNAHLVIVANMPFMGGNFLIGPDVFCDDRRLDVFVYSELGKRDLIEHALQLLDTAADARIQRFRVQSIAITTNPPMPVMADGVMLGSGPVTISLQSRRLRVMAGSASIAAADLVRGSASQASVSSSADVPASATEAGTNPPSEDHARVANA